MNIKDLDHCPRCGGADIRHVKLASGAIRLVCADCMKPVSVDDEKYVRPFSEFAENLKRGYMR